LLFFIDPPTAVLHALCLHDALAIYLAGFPARECGRMVAGLEAEHAVRGAGEDSHVSDVSRDPSRSVSRVRERQEAQRRAHTAERSEEHTSELQSRENLVCRLLLENT